MAIWEYEVLTFEPRQLYLELRDELRLRGEQGWEMVGMTPIAPEPGAWWGGVTTSIVVVFKRPRIDEPAPGHETPPVQEASLVVAVGPVVEPPVRRRRWSLWPRYDIAEGSR